MSNVNNMWDKGTQYCAILHKVGVLLEFKNFQRRVKKHLESLL